MYSFPFPLSSLARVLFLPANRNQQDKAREMPIAFLLSSSSSSSIATRIESCIFSLSLSSIIAQQLKKCWNIGRTFSMVSQRDRNGISCYANESLETEIRNVSFRSLVEGRRQGKAVCFESKVFFQFSIRFSFHPSSFQFRPIDECIRKLMKDYVCAFYEKF